MGRQCPKQYATSLTGAGSFQTNIDRATVMSNQINSNVYDQFCWLSDCDDSERYAPAVDWCQKELELFDLNKQSISLHRWPRWNASNVVVWRQLLDCMTSSFSGAGFLRRQTSVHGHRKTTLAVKETFFNYYHFRIPRQVLKTWSRGSTATENFGALQKETRPAEEEYFAAVSRDRQKHELRCPTTSWQSTSLTNAIWHICNPQGTTVPDDPISLLTRRRHEHFQKKSLLKSRRSKANHPCRRMTSVTTFFLAFTYHRESIIKIR